jgi:hypothetical protein
MSIALLINGIDRTSYIEKSSFSFKNIANDEVDGLDLTLRVKQSELATVKPIYGQSVELIHNGNTIFGGTVQALKEKEIGFNVFDLTCSIKDYSFNLVAKRVADVFENVIDLYVINMLINDYLNLDKKIIDGMETGWSAGTADTTNFVEGTQSIKIQNTNITKSVTLDLTNFANGQVSTDDDYIDFWAYVSNYLTLNSITITFGDSSLVNTYSYQFVPGFYIFKTGWNYFHVKKADFTGTNSPDWTTIQKVKLATIGMSYVSFDDIRMISQNGYNKTNIATDNPVDIKYLPYNYLPLFQAVQTLAEYTGKYWYVDYNKSVHYFSPGFEVAPFTLEDNNGKMIGKSLEVNEDGTQIKNIIYVRGGEFLSATRNEQNELGDGLKRSWSLDYRGTDLRIFIDTGSGFVQEVVGLDNIDQDDGTKDWFWNNSEKVVKQASAGTTLATTHKIKIDMFPYLPVLVQVPDNASIAKYGENEMLIIDKNIKTKEGARERALTELRAYKDTLVDCSFSTLSDGLKAGQQIQIISAKRNINDFFIIWSIGAKMHTDDDFMYDVELISSKKLTLANTLIQLLLARTKEVIVDSNETLDKYKPHLEDIKIGELHTVSLHTAQPCKWGPHAEQGTYTTYYKYS